MNNLEKQKKLITVVLLLALTFLIVGLASENLDRNDKNGSRENTVRHVITTNGLECVEHRRYRQMSCNWDKYNKESTQ